MQNQAPLPDKTRFERIRARMENSLLLAWVLVTGVCVVGISSFVEAAAKLYANTKIFLPIEQRRVEFDAKTHDQILVAAKQIDALLLKLSDTPPEKRQFEPFKSDYENVEVELDNLLLRSRTRPLNNNFTTHQVRLLLDHWRRLKELHRKQNALSDAFIEEYKTLATGMFEAVAATESGVLNSDRAP